MDLGQAHAAPIADMSKLLIDRLREEVVLFPAFSTRLVGYMAWPNDEEERTAWLKAHETCVCETSPSVESDQPHRIVEIQPLEAFYNHVVRIQRRWSRVADILHHHYDLSQGGHQLSRGGASLGKTIHIVSNNAVSRGTGAAKLWEFWTAYKDVAHLVTAAILITAEAKARGLHHLQMQPVRIVMLVPELVLAVAMSFERYGLEMEVHGREEPLFDPNTLWRIPDNIGIAPFEPPTREIRVPAASKMRTRAEKTEGARPIAQ